MAFSEPVNEDLIVVLQSPCQVHSGCNLLRRSTLGLSRLFRQISESFSIGGIVSQCISSHSDASGRLNLGAPNPCMLQRYTLHAMIGEGTFSQIYRATDSYSSKVVAIKVMRVGLHLLGMRETSFLRYLNSKELRGSQSFLKVLGAFRFQRHFCLVLDLYDTTLLSLLCMPNLNPSRSADALRSIEQDKVSSTIHQPRVVRHKFSRTVESSDTSELRLLDMKKIRQIATTFVMALCILRMEGAIHADIKPENCFLRARKECTRGVEKKDNVSTVMTPSSESILLPRGVNALPDEFDLHLGDFGNSIHVSDVSKYYTDFDLQTLSYRAPEVLLGVPFGYQIDMWSLGILLIEICIGKPLFLVRNRQELYNAMCTHLTAPPRIRFAGGMYSDLLSDSASSLSEKTEQRQTPSTKFQSMNSTPSNFDFALHLSNVKRLLDKHVTDAPHDLTHFLAGLVHPDPDHRLTAQDALRHPMVSQGLNTPLCLIGNYVARPAQARASVAGLRSQLMKSKLASATLSSPHHLATLSENAPVDSLGVHVCSQETVRNDTVGHERENNFGLCRNRDKYVHEKSEIIDAVAQAESRESPLVTTVESLEKIKVESKPTICGNETTKSATELGNRKVGSHLRSRKTSSLLSLPAPAFRSTKCLQSNSTYHEELDSITPPESVPKSTTSSDSQSLPTAYSAPGKGVVSAHVEEANAVIIRMSNHKYLRTSDSENSTSSLSASLYPIPITESFGVTEALIDSCPKKRSHADSRSTEELSMKTIRKFYLSGSKY